MDPKVGGLRYVDAGGYYVTREASAHLHKGERRLLKPPGGGACTHSLMVEGEPCAWCGEPATNPIRWNPLDGTWSR